MLERQKITYHPYQRLYVPIIGIILGISFSYYFYHGHYINVLSILTISLFTLLLLQKSNLKAKKVSLFFSFFLIGSFALFLQYYSAYRSQNMLPQGSCDLVACVKDKDNSLTTDESEVIDLLILKSKTNATCLWTNTQSSIHVYAKSKSQFEVGDILHIKNIILNIPPNHRDSQETPSFSDYLYRKGLVATIFTPRLQGTLLHRPTICFSRAIAQSRNSTLSVGTKALSNVTKSLYSTIFLGKKAPNLQQEQWRNWGILHLLARSGIHAVIFLILCMFFLKIVPLNYWIKQIFFLSTLLFYVLLSWPSTSFLRAIFVMISTLLGKLLNKQISFIHTLCILTIFSLCINPLQLFFLDFQLSYGLTFIIMWWVEQSKTIQKVGTSHAKTQKNLRALIN